VKQLLSDPELGKRVGERAHRKVLERFLITRHLLDYLELFNTLT